VIEWRLRDIERRVLAIERRVDLIEWRGRAVARTPKAAEAGTSPNQPE